MSGFHHDAGGHAPLVQVECALTNVGLGPDGAGAHGARFAFDTEHAIGKGANAQAAAYVETISDGGKVRWGIGVDPNITTASLRAVLCAFERHQR